ncbi:prepilin-type N-terminal cleavage/methylation domain-containing protein [Vibrio sp. MA40-2]|uniref:prepilin-type N-terminal cleavage/methylation domain-containing protein n=1 Tax=Vibrio sp. MA40-2 TaxID=3391828 RepID=UPI0039A57EBB
MVMQNVELLVSDNNDKGKGFTLIEMLISSVITALALTTLMSVMIVSTASAQKEMSLLLLHNSVSETLRFIQDDLRRAKSVTFSLTELSYFYQDAGQYVRTTIKIDDVEHKLKYCSEKNPTAAHSTACYRFYSMFDPSQMKVTRFTIQEKVIDTENNKKLIELSLSVELVKQQQVFTLVAQVSPRNS